ncbi:MAG: UDP-N-acetylmuramoyl-L-alanine--D-glutamate ligase, partial [Planctomycetota bacterium]
RYVLGEHREADFAAADVVVVNPAVRPDHPCLAVARAHGASIVTEVGTVLRLAHGMTVGVTGSNGKSTTTALLGHMLRAVEPRTLVGGNLGGSLLPQMKTHWPSAPLVLELSSFQLHYLGEQALAPRVAVITQLAPNHLDWHGSLAAYYDAKRNILRRQSWRDLAILNAADPVLRDWAAACCSRVGRFALDDPGGPNAAFVRDGQAIARLAGEEQAGFALADLPLPGRHNVENALAALLAARAVLGDVAAAGRAAPGFRGLPHRLEPVGAIGGVRFVNDSVATTPESAVAALSSTAGPTVLIAGGYDKGLPFDALAAVVAEQATAAVLLGDAADRIAAALDAAGFADRTHRAGTLAEAVDAARRLCPAGGTVLLSPACASYGAFTDFEARGEAFRRLVQERGAAGKESGGGAEA